MVWPFSSPVSSSVPPPHEPTPSDTPHKPRNTEAFYFAALRKCTGLSQEKKTSMKDILNSNRLFLLAFMEAYDKDPTDTTIQQFYEDRIESFRRMLHTLITHTSSP
jgi:hypothetical protein